MQPVLVCACHVQYAEPPVRERRFAEATLKAPWAAPGDPSGKIQSAHDYGHKCVQSVGDGLEGNEDCLVLNVWRAHGTDERSNLPVMFWCARDQNAIFLSYRSWLGADAQSPAQDPRWSVHKRCRRSY